jgi:hypothetical protein
MSGESGIVIWSAFHLQNIASHSTPEKCCLALKLIPTT